MGTNFERIPIQLGVVSERFSPNQPTFTQEVSYLGALVPCK